MNFAHYTGRTMTQVRNSLIKRGMPAQERHRFLDELKAYRSKMRSEAAQSLHYRKTWQRFAKPLVKELRKVQVALYYQGSARRKVALMDYQALLTELLNLFKGFSAGTRSPKEIAQYNRIPNDGAHWTDWIPYDEKERIMDAFDLAREKGRKIYQAFPREEDKGV